MTPSEERELNAALAELQKAAMLVKQMESANTQEEWEKIKNESSWNLAGMVIRKAMRK